MRRAPRSAASSSRGRQFDKYYETHSHTWWWLTHARRTTMQQLWVIEDDVVFTGDWLSLLDALDRSLPQDGDFVTFRELCTPLKGWAWIKW